MSVPFLRSKLTLKVIGLLWLKVMETLGTMMMMAQWAVETLEAGEVLGSGETSSGCEAQEVSDSV